MKKIFTIGHSNHMIDNFYKLLDSNDINCIIDVRSTPASKYNPQYNQEPLKNYLKIKGIAYMHFKNEFGARQESSNVLNENGQVDFELFRKTKNFKTGIERVNLGLSKGYRIALMCSESNPLECHRFSMISVYLAKMDFKISHILKDNTIISQKKLEIQLLDNYKKKISKPSLFEPNIDKLDIIKQAYKLHNKDIGWVHNKYTEIKNKDLYD
ncbi:DUF488 domain-containing protein [Tenacibaculum finnmarkense]|uniref:DUF488 domain-containing protein n=1 Tax=Tenacibaculum finnmarkense TaxID=2781243 RepID=UPI001EFB365C|nr:DUF488 domain-containing protein [Tenacibaculum finnmarkense]MCG8883985.1 DUF488 domain-containing protein [Tenacibaculum finnmarkense]